MSVQVGKRQDANVIFNSSMGVLFGVEKYASALWKVVKERDIRVNLRHELVEVKPGSKEAVFRLLDQDTLQTFPVGRRKMLNSIYFVKCLMQSYSPV